MAETKTSATAEVVTGALRVDLERRMVWMRGERVWLERREYDFLEQLCRSLGGLVLKSTIKKQIYGQYPPSSDTLKIFASRVRKKLGLKRNELIVTKCTEGYYLLDLPPVRKDMAQPAE